MEYSVKPCDISEGTVTAFSMNASSGVVRIHQVQDYVCCANITLSMKTDGSTIRIYEDNIGEMCRCICNFESDITVMDAEGYGRIEIYGIRFRDVQGYGLLFNSTIPG